MRIVIFRILIALSPLLLAGCGAKVEPVNEVVAFATDEAPLDPTAADWDDVPAFEHR